MVITFIRTLIVYITLIIVMRLMGKRQIAEMQPFEFVVTLIIADLACIPMTDVSIPLLYGIVAIITLFIVHQIFSILEQSGPFIKSIINGKPSIVINKNGVDLVELKRNNLGVDDLIESMRSSGYYSFDDLSYAIFESNGILSPLENPDRQNKNPALPLLVISEGKTNFNNIIKLNTTSDNLNNFLVKNNLKTKNIEILTIDENGRVYLKEKKQKYKILNFCFGGNN